MKKVKVLFNWARDPEVIEVQISSNPEKSESQQIQTVVDRRFGIYDVLKWEVQNGN